MPVVLGGTGGIVDARGIGDVGGASADAGTTLNSTGNLIVNGDAEEGVGSSDGSRLRVPGWTVTGEATAVQYGVMTCRGAYTLQATIRVGEPGTQFLFGRSKTTQTSTLAQTIRLASYATGIDAGAGHVRSPGYLGGFSTQDDNAVLSVSFKNASGTELAAATIGPVTEPDGSGLTASSFAARPEFPDLDPALLRHGNHDSPQGTYNEHTRTIFRWFLTGI